MQIWIVWLGAGLFNRGPKFFHIGLSYQRNRCFYFRKPGVTSPLEVPFIFSKTCFYNVTEPQTSNHD